MQKSAGPTMVMNGRDNDPMRDLLRVVLRVAVGMAFLGVVVAIIVGVATATVAIVAMLVAVGVAVRLVRWATGRLPRGATPHGVSGVHDEDKSDPATGSASKVAPAPASQGRFSPVPGVVVAGQARTTQRQTTARAPNETSADR
jgi:hypothetical protein